MAPYGVSELEPLVVHGNSCAEQLEQVESSYLVRKSRPPPTPTMADINEIAKQVSLSAAL